MDPADRHRNIQKSFFYGPGARGEDKDRLTEPERRISRVPADEGEAVAEYLRFLGETR